MEDCGAVYKESGKDKDPYQIFADHGANLVRVRLWHTPSWYDELNDGQRYSDLADVMQTISRAKTEGMDVLLDFHLSDTWADPTRQIVPAAWADVVENLPVLQDSLYNYIYSTLSTLAQQDLLPELVQIGNETNKGILLSQEVNDSGWVLDWNRNSALFNSAIAAVRAIENDHTAEIKIALHISDPGAVEWYIDQFVSHDVTDFDVIGISYYKQWHDMTFAEVSDVIADLKNEYEGKEVMIFETAYPWTTINADGANNILSATTPGYTPFSPANQLRWLKDFTQIVINAGADGVIYWEPAWVSTGCETQWVSGSSWDNATFFNHQKELIENGGIGWMKAEYVFLTSSEDQNFSKKIFIICQNDLLKIQNADQGQLFIYSIEGRLIFQKHIFEENETFKLNDLLQGVYLVVVETASVLRHAELIPVFK